MKLGVLKRVPLREVWRHEGNDFSKWLAAPERSFDTTITELLRCVVGEKACGWR